MVGVGNSILRRRAPGTREAGKDQLDSLQGTREAGKNHLNSLGGTRETRSTGMPIESRFWKGAGFCLTFNTISMAIGPVRGKSWGGAPAQLFVARAPSRAPAASARAGASWQPL